ncbi:MAG: zf-HC2 domain-containing protein [Candidatus Sulfotelmatobacter sp.]
MVCEYWKEKLDIYLDAEVPAEEMRTFDAHVRSCSSCAGDALTRVQMKRAIQIAGKRYAPGAEFRRRIQRKIAPGAKRSFALGWMPVAVAAAILAIGMLTSAYLGARSVRGRMFSEIADLHVATLASSTPVDVISTDRHTVKPWFQGKIPFSFNLPDLQNSEFSLLGGRMTYLDQSPGAHLIYDVRKHHISVFVFQERSLKLTSSLGENSPSPQQLSFNMETWTQGGLRYFVIGDAGVADIATLAKMFKAAS